MEVTMLRKLRARMTYANVVSTIALGLAIGGGTAYAATKIGTGNIRYHAVTASKLATNSVTASKIKNNAVSGSDIRNNSVTGDDVRTGSLLASDFAPNQLPKGDKGDKGDPATSIYGVLGQTGVMSNSKNVTGVSVNGNEYTVTSNQDVSKCAAVATATGNAAGIVTAAPTAGNVQQITFATFDDDGTDAPRAFQFAVYC
jgi:hypothetical protein